VHDTTFKYNNLIVEDRRCTLKQYGDLQCGKYWAGRG